MEKSFKKEEIIWGKIRGFPWWPGIVIFLLTKQIGKVMVSNSNLRETKYLVNFIGDETHAEIPISKIEKFDKKYDDYSNTKLKALLKSIEFASKIHSGQLSYNSYKKIKKDEIREEKEMLNCKSNVYIFYLMNNQTDSIFEKQF